jgi:hypothetical protein
MKFRLCAAALCLFALHSFAGTSDSKNVVSDTSKNSGGPIVEINPGPKISFEFDASETYVGNGDVKRPTGAFGDLRVENFDENDALVRFVLTPRTKIGILRFGGSYERWDFGLNDRLAQIPDTLQAANFVVGIDSEFSDSLVFRIEAHPGWYSAGRDSFAGDSFRVPIIVGGSYIFNPNFQLVLGAAVNFEGKYAVMPGGGIRWKFYDGWTLNAVMPNPRLEWQATRNLTLYAGAAIEQETFRVDEHFGDFRPDARLIDRRLDNAWMTYSEVRTGLGFEWEMVTGVKLALEGGYQPYRQFDFFRPHVRYHEDGGAPYGTAALHVAF